MKTVPTIDQLVPRGLNMRRVAVTFALSVGVLALSLPAHATGLTRTFVSSTGVDTNPCTTAAPCASFAKAYTEVVPNGIVAALDPGKYGPLTITSSVTIDGNGWSAITSPANGNGIVVAAGAGNVVLRGLTIDGAQTAGTYGILYSSGASLTIDGCVIRNMFSGGLELDGSPSTAQNLTITNSSFENDNTAVLVDPSGSGAVSVAFDAVQITGNSTNGLFVTSNSGTGDIHVAVSNSVISNNAVGGAWASSTAATTNLYLTNVQVANNGEFGVQSTGSSAVVWLAQSTVASNAAGYSAQSSGVINSYGDNYFANNGANTGSLTAASPGKQ
jgi:hypothetical protein